MGHERDMVQRYCAVCGHVATNRHHEPPKGLGGIGAYGEEPPVISLCGSGTTGCHGSRHHGDLKLRWHEGGWQWRGRSKSASGRALFSNEWADCRPDGFWEVFDR